MMTVKQIVAKYIRENRFDGLFYRSECGCLLSDFMPCEEVNPDCTAGFKCKDPTGETDWIVKGEKDGK